MTTPQLSLHHKQVQQQTLSPRLQQAVRLLQLSSLDFNLELQALQGQNPFLEFLDFDAEPEEAQADDEAGSGADLDRDPWLASASDLARGAAQHESGDTSVLEFLPRACGLAEHLHLQLSLMRLSERDAALAHALIDSLDDDGYLRAPLDELLPDEALDPPPEPQELLTALRYVQSLEPLGVGARDLQECLKLQLGTIDCPKERALAAHVIEHELTALAKHQWAGMARSLGCTPEQLDAACRRIRQMDPRPGLRHSLAQTRYITPDVVVRKRRGGWTAELNRAVMPRVSFNKTYADLLQQHAANSPSTPELAEHLSQARWTVRNIEQRFSTIASVAQSIVDRQRHFFDYGPMAMKPLGLREIAEELGMHESTVSRVTANKYMATPGGVFELKHFFSRAHVSRGGNSCSPTAIRGLVQKMLSAEPPGVALSDAEIARRLSAQGLDVARRTVTKYRQMLHIDPCDQRLRRAS